MPWQIFPLQKHTKNVNGMIGTGSYISCAFNLFSMTNWNLHIFIMSWKMMTISWTLAHQNQVWVVVFPYLFSALVKSVISHLMYRLWVGHVLYWWRSEPWWGLLSSWWWSSIDTPWWWWCFLTVFVDWCWVYSIIVWLRKCSTYNSQVYVAIATHHHIMILWPCVYIVTLYIIM